jgi:hypothetical protein
MTWYSAKSSNVSYSRSLPCHIQYSLPREQNRCITENAYGAIAARKRESFRRSSLMEFSVLQSFFLCDYVVGNF